MTWLPPLDVEVSSCPVQGNGSLQKLLGRCRGQRSRGTVQWSIRHLHQRPWFGCAPQKKELRLRTRMKKNTSLQMRIRSFHLQLSASNRMMMLTYESVFSIDPGWSYKYQHLQDGSSRLLARSIYLKQNDKWKKDRYGSKRFKIWDRFAYVS